MMNTVNQFYQQQIKPLPMIDCVQLARLIMDDLSEFVSFRQAQDATRSNIDSDDIWSDEDLYDASRASLLYAAQMLDDEDDYEDYNETR